MRKSSYEILRLPIVPLRRARCVTSGDFVGYQAVLSACFSGSRRAAPAPC